MRKNYILAAVAAFFAIGAGAAHAASLFGGPIDGGSASINAFCWITNEGSKGITLSSMHITNAAGTGIAVTGTCGTVTPLAPKASCYVIAPLTPTTGAVSCDVSSSVLMTMVRGTLTVAIAGNVPLASTPLR